MNTYKFNAEDFFCKIKNELPAFKPGASTQDVITVIADTHQMLGKQFTVMPDGTVGKRAQVSTSWAEAMQFDCPTADDLAAVLRLVGTSPHVAVINAAFPSVPLGQRFRIASQLKIRQKFGPQADTRGVHSLNEEGYRLTVVGRVKEQTTASTWQLLDRDVDKYTPTAFRDATFDEWLTQVDRILPGVVNATRVVVPSASARVMRNGKPVGNVGNGHVWVQVADPTDVERTRTAIIGRAIALGLAWTKPKLSRTTDEVVGRGWATVVDPSVWTVGRLVFDGAPAPGEGLTVAPHDVRVTKGEEGLPQWLMGNDQLRPNARLDTSAAVIDAQAIEAASEAVGQPLRVVGKGDRLEILSEDLRLDTVLELEGGELAKVEALVRRPLDGGKIRCQAPFRASTSMAAFFAVGPVGGPFVFDSGTGVKHVLPQTVLQAAQVATAQAVVAAAVAGDVGAPFEPQALAALAAVRGSDPAAWARIRERLKDAKVGIGDLEQRLKQTQADAAEDDRSVADRLIAMARERCRFARDEQRMTYAVFKSQGARQVHRIDSQGFSDFLSHTYYSDTDRAPSEMSLKVALNTLRGQGLFEGETCKVFTRIAKTEAGYWLDLCNEAWQCVQITATGWQVVAGETAPLFTRSASMRPLPLPERGGSLDALWPLVNIPEPDRRMVLAWLLECLRDDTPHVVLELVGEQGSAKSFTQRFLRRLIDPNQADLRSAPKSVEDVWIAAFNSHMVSLENLSHLSAQYQDALCVLATGGGYSARTLYTNSEETILELRKPIVLNGISVVVTAQDLLDRCVHIDLPTISHRETAGDIDARFEAAQPSLLGALLDLFTKALATLPSVNIDPRDRPRMADFAVLGEALSRVMGGTEGAFLDRHAAMRRESILTTIDGSPVGAALLAFLERNPAGFEGSLSELLVQLETFRQTHDFWPRSSKGLGDALRRLSPALRLIGFECKSLPKTGGAIRWRISSCDPQLSGPRPGSPGSPAEDTTTGRTFGAIGTFSQIGGMSGTFAANPSVRA
jgi:hypothetical protein